MRERIKNNFKKEIKSYTKQVQLLSSYYETYKEMKYGDKNIEKVYKVAPNFFSICRRAMLDETILILCKFLDKKYKSKKNLLLFINKIESELKKGYISSEKKDIIKKIEVFKNQLENLAINNSLYSIRDKVIGHFDYIEPSKDFLLENSFKDKEIETTIEKIKEILDYLSDVVGAGKNQYNYLNENDFKKLVFFCLKNIEDWYLYFKVA